MRWRRRAPGPGEVAVVENAETRSEVRVLVDADHAEGRVLTDFDVQLVGRAARLYRPNHDAVNILIVEPSGWFLIAGSRDPFDPAADQM